MNFLELLTEGELRASAFAVDLFRRRAQQAQPMRDRPRDRRAPRPPESVKIKSIAGFAAGRRHGALQVRHETRNVTDVHAIENLKAPIFDALPDVARAAGTRVDGFNIVRSLEYDSDAKSFRIISGTDGNAESGFGFWRWSGAGAPQREQVMPHIAARAAKPEDITRVAAGFKSYTLVVFDTSRYVTMR